MYRALREWVAHVDMPAALVAADPLFLSAFDVVGASITAEVTTGLPLDHGEAAAEVVVAGLQAYRRLAPENMPMVQAIVPRVMTLRPLYQQAVAAGEDGEDAAFELARVFTEMGEAYIELIVGAQELEQVSVFAARRRCCLCRPALSAPLPPHQPSQNPTGLDGRPRPHVHR